MGRMYVRTRVLLTVMFVFAHDMAHGEARPDSEL